MHTFWLVKPMNSAKQILPIASYQENNIFWYLSKGVDILFSSGGSSKDEATDKSLFIKEIHTFPEG